MRGCRMTAVHAVFELPVPANVPVVGVAPTSKPWSVTVREAASPEDEPKAASSTTTSRTAVRDPMRRQRVAACRGAAAVAGLVLEEVTRLLEGLVLGAVQLPLRAPDGEVGAQQRLA